MTNASQLAHHYFDLSNAGSLEEIKNLFTPSSTYSSASTGVYLGVDQIMAMQQQFFASFSTMNWDIHSAEEVKPGVTLFMFTFTGKTLDGDLIHQKGWEYVIVYNDKLQHVEVRRRD